jgi:hypothetical protein
MRITVAYGLDSAFDELCRGSVTRTVVVFDGA